MLTKKQIEKEAAAYTNENNGSGFEFQAFIVGAEWADEQMQAENERLASENRRLFEQAAALQAENGVLRANLDAAIKVDQFDQYRDEVAKAVQGLRAKNELLTEALLWAIADLETMHDSAGTPPGERHLIEKLKKAME